MPKSYRLKPEMQINGQRVRENRLGFAKDVKRQYHTPGCNFGPGYENKGQFVAPAIEKVILKGFR